MRGRDAWRRPPARLAAGFLALAASPATSDADQVELSSRETLRGTVKLPRDGEPRFHSEQLGLSTLAWGSSIRSSARGGSSLRPSAQGPAVPEQSSPWTR